MRSPVVTPADELARRHYEQQQLLAARVATAATMSWRAIDVDDIAGSWAVRVPALAATVSAAQRVAASAADRYVDGALVVADTPIDPEGTLVTARFAGVASDGRPLNSLLVQPAVTSLRAISVGVDASQALEAGLAALTRMVVTQISDAGRVADGVATISRPRVGYVRMLAPPSCSRCAILAGARYRSSQPFQRHPRCDCRHIPVAESIIGDVTVDSRRYFDSLTEAEQEKIFTVDGARAIRDGADLNQVVNARRGMSAAGTTTEGTTRRGFAGRRAGASSRSTGSRFGQATASRARSAPRLMPEELYRQAGGDRDLAMSLLRQHGFVV